MWSNFLQTVNRFSGRSTSNERYFFSFHRVQWDENNRSALPVIDVNVRSSTNHFIRIFSTMKTGVVKRVEISGRHRSTFNLSEILAKIDFSFSSFGRSFSSMLRASLNQQNTKTCFTRRTIDIQRRWTEKHIWNTRPDWTMSLVSTIDLSLTEKRTFSRSWPSETVLLNSFLLMRCFSFTGCCWSAEQINICLDRQRSFIVSWLSVAILLTEIFSSTGILSHCDRTIDGENSRKAKILIGLLFSANNSSSNVSFGHHSIELSRQPEDEKQTFGSFHRPISNKKNSPNFFSNSSLRHW